MNSNVGSERQHRLHRVHKSYQLAFILVDFGAALLFVIGSILFFNPDRASTGTWFFLVGSVFFAVKPTLRLSRFLHLRSIARSAELSLEHVLGGRHFF